MFPYAKKILSFCYNKHKKAGEIANFLELSDSTYFRNVILLNFVNENYLLRITEGKTAFYKTNKEKVF